MNKQNIKRPNLVDYLRKRQIPSIRQFLTQFYPKCTSDICLAIAFVIFFALYFSISLTSVQQGPFHLKQVINRFLFQHNNQEQQVSKLKKQILELKGTVDEIRTLVDPFSENINKYQIYGNRIKRISNDHNQDYLLGIVPIGEKNMNTFTLQNVDGQLLIGIVNPRSFIDLNQMQNSKQLIYFSVNSGIIQDNDVKVAGVPRTNNQNVIVMTVRQDTVIWMINGRQIAYKNSLINKKWVPIISLRKSGDIITWK